MQTLRCGESDVAIVGSSLLCLSPDMFIAMANSSVLGPTGKCFAWDDRAEGYGRGESLFVSLRSRTCLLHQFKYALTRLALR